MKDVLMVIGICLLGLLVGGFIATSIYCFITYGNLPIDEVPIWALWFMFGGGN